jgi:hypothetical protein
MASIQVRTNGAGDQTYEPLPPDIYYMKIREADITLSSFKDQKTGEDQYQLALVWEISRLTAEQQEAEIDDSRWVRQWLSLFYGETKKGPSKLKEFIDTLQSQGLLMEFDPANGEIDSDWFEGIEQRVTLGVKGNYNDVRMVSSLKVAKKAPAHAKNAPQRIRSAPPVEEQGEVDEDGIF